MTIKKWVASAAVALGVSSAGLASAQTFGSVSFDCAPNWGPVTISISVSVPAADRGLPGAVWVGLLDDSDPSRPDLLASLTPSGWVPNDYSGFQPPLAIERQGLSGSYGSTTVKPWSVESQRGYFAESPWTTGQLAGMAIVVGHGSFSAEDEATVQRRIELLAQMRPERVANGTWNARYDDPSHIEQLREALVTRDVRDNSRIVGRVPAMTCPTEPSGGN